MSVIIEGTIPTPDNPRILWNNLALGASAVGNNEGPLNLAVFAIQPQTYTSWRPESVPAVLSVSLPSSAVFDAIALGCHTLGSSGATVEIEYYISSSKTWVSVATLTPTDDRAILVLTEEVSLTGQSIVRFVVTGAVAEIGYASVGLAMTFPHKSRFAPALPITEAEQYAYSVNTTDGGSWVGRSMVSRGLRFGFDVSNISEAFAQGEFADFRKHANEGDATFFIAPKPTSYPQEVAYAWCEETIKADRVVANQGLSRQVSLKCSGYYAV